MVVSPWGAPPGFLDFVFSAIESVDCKNVARRASAYCLWAMQAMNANDAAAGDRERGEQGATEAKGANARGSVLFDAGNRRARHRAASRGVAGLYCDTANRSAVLR